MLTEALSSIYLVIGLTLLGLALLVALFIGVAMKNQSYPYEYESAGEYDNLSFSLRWVFSLPIAVLGGYFLLRAFLV